MKAFRIHSNSKVRVALTKRVLGTVKWQNVKSCYGFINRDVTHEDGFVRKTATTFDRYYKVRRTFELKLRGEAPSTPS